MYRLVNRNPVLMPNKSIKVKWAGDECIILNVMTPFLEAFEMLLQTEDEFIGAVDMMEDNGAGHCQANVYFINGDGMLQFDVYEEGEPEIEYPECRNIEAKHMFELLNKMVYMMVRPIIK